MNIATSRYPNQRSPLQRPEPIGDGVALFWNIRPIRSAPLRIAGRGSADVAQLMGVVGRLITLNVVFGTSANRQIAIAHRSS